MKRKITPLRRRVRKRIEIAILLKYLKAELRERKARIELSANMLKTDFRPFSDTDTRERVKSLVSNRTIIMYLTGRVTCLEEDLKELKGK